MSLARFMGVNEVKPETSKPEPEDENVTTLSEQETEEIRKFLEECRKNRENWAYVSVSYVCDYRIDGKSEGLRVTHNVERPFKQEGDSYGGMWGERYYSKEGVGEFLEDTREFVQRLLNQPYKESLKGGEVHFLRDVKDENVRIFVTDGARKLLVENGIDVDEYLSQLHGMKGRIVADEELELCEKYEKTEKEIEKLKKRMDNIKEIVCKYFDVSDIFYNTQRNGRQGLNQFTDTIDFNVLHREYVESEGLVRKYKSEMKMIRDYFNSGEKHWGVRDNR